MYTSWWKEQSSTESTNHNYTYLLVLLTKLQQENTKHAMKIDELKD